MQYGNILLCIKYDSLYFMKYQYIMMGIIRHQFKHLNNTGAHVVIQSKYIIESLIIKLQ